MKILYSIVFPLIVGALCTLTCAQQAAPQIDQHNAGCDALSGSVPDNVRAIASTLNICGDVQRALRHGRSRIAPPGALEKQIVPEEQGQAPSSSEAESSQKKTMADLEARRSISEAISRATLDSNLVTIQLSDALIERQVASFNAQQRAFDAPRSLGGMYETSGSSLWPVNQ